MDIDIWRIPVVDSSIWLVERDMAKEFAFIMVALEMERNKNSIILFCLLL